MDAARGVLVTALALVTWCLTAAHGVPRHPAATGSEAVRHLAQALGFPEEVRFSHRRPPPPPVFMLDLYNSVADGRGRWRGPTPYDASVVRSYKEAEPISAAVLQFDIPTSSADEELLEAELHVYVPHVAHVPHVRQVQVWQVTEDGVDRPVDSRLAPAVGGWLVLHLQQTSAARPAGQPPLALRLTEETSGGRRRQLNVSRRGHHHNKQPLLVLYSRDNRTSHHQAINDELARQARSSAVGRSRRSVPSEIPAGCGRRELYIDFEEIGWAEFVVAPPGYEAFHCLGRCEFPLTQDQRPTNHATVQSLVHQLGLSSWALVQRPSCVPSALGSLHVLFSPDDNTVVLKKYMDMVAEECGCQ